MGNSLYKTDIPLLEILNVYASSNKMKLVCLIFTVLIVAVSGGIQFQEEFDSYESFEKSFEIEIVSSPHNNELQYYTDRLDNIRVENGHLVITPLRENYGGKQYTSGRMHSRFGWLYGRVEVRAKLPKGDGLWPAIWMMPKGSVYGGWPNSGEIDICEARGYNLQEVASTIHYGGPGCCDNNRYESSGDLHTNCHINEYHVYTLDWTPTELVYRLDGNAYHRHDLDRNIMPSFYKNEGEPFNQIFHLILNTAVGGWYVTPPTPNTQWSYPDAEMWVDYVRVYHLEDIASTECRVIPGSNPNDICGNVNWACYGQGDADVSAHCTFQLDQCCDNPDACDYNLLMSLASDVFSSYDEQINDDTSCHFSGTAKRYFELYDGSFTAGDAGQCLVKDSAQASDICGAMQWACYDQNYANVAYECSVGQTSLNCCNSDPSKCDDQQLRYEAGAVFDSYYSQLLTPSACDFGGVCELEGGSGSIECTDGFGA